MSDHKEIPEWAKEASQKLCTHYRGIRPEYIAEIIAAHAPASTPSSYSAEDVRRLVKSIDDYTNCGHPSYCPKWRGKGTCMCGWDTIEEALKPFQEEEE